MSEISSKEIRLKSRPVGMPTADHFELATVQLSAPNEGEVLVRNIYLSVDPYMRGRMVDQESYVPPFQIGETLSGGAVGQVVASRSAELKPGDYVSSMFGWREYYVAKPTDGLTKIDSSAGPIQAYLGVLGMPGLTAYAGLLRIAALIEGETVLVSAASGAVGSIVCQIAKAKNCTVVGTAGSDEKCSWLEGNAGIDKAINYRTAGDLTRAIKEAAPRGIDVYFENVGGEHLVAAINNMRNFGRIAVCGMIEQYNQTDEPKGPYNIILTVMKRLKIQGFIVSDHVDLAEQFLTDMNRWIKDGKVKWEETIFEGIENTPEAFLGLFKGANMGKMLVKVGPDPAF